MRSNRKPRKSPPRRSLRRQRQLLRNTRSSSSREASGTPDPESCWIIGMFPEEKMSLSRSKKVRNGNEETDFLTGILFDLLVNQGWPIFVVLWSLHDISARLLDFVRCSHSPMIQFKTC